MLLETSSQVCQSAATVKGCLVERHYLVCFDDGQENECSSNILKVETLSSSLPPDIPLPAHDMVWDISAVEEASGDPDVLDNEEVEDMPAIRPKEEDAEAANEEENLSDTASFKKTAEALQDNNDIHDPNEQMPGQKPMEESAMVKDYHSIKKQQRRKLQPWLELR